MSLDWVLSGLIESWINLDFLSEQAGSIILLFSDRFKSWISHVPGRSNFITKNKNRQD